MWEYITSMLSAMVTDRLWIYTAIAGSLLGAAFLFWFKDTKTQSMNQWLVFKAF